MGGWTSGRVREAAVEMLSARLPSSAGDEWFESELCEGRSSDPGFDPAPQLPNWLLSKLGCDDSRLVSRGRSWTRSGADRLISGAHRLTCWTVWDLGMEPSAGDVLMIGDRRRGEQMHPCVFVRSEGGVWTTADVLPCPRTGAMTASFVERTVKGESMTGRSGQSRRILGWVDLERVPYGATAA